MKKIFRFIIICLFIAFIITLSINLNIIFNTRQQIHKEPSKSAKYVLILGSGIQGDKPSPMLKERLDKGIKIAKEIDAKIILSGDEGPGHPEITVMNKYTEDKFPSDKIIKDNNGLNTSKSITNYKNYSSEEVIIVSQRYHLYRSLFIANTYKVNASGVPAKNPKSIKSFTYNFFREIGARNKDFIKMAIKNLKNH